MPRLILILRAEIGFNMNRIKEYGIYNRIQKVVPTGLKMLGWIHFTKWSLLWSLILTGRFIGKEAHNELYKPLLDGLFD